MCIQVQVTYRRCSHLHVGYELCLAFNPETRRCGAVLQQHPRLDPFCPLCSKREYRAHRARGRARPQQQQQQHVGFPAQMRNPLHLPHEHHADAHTCRPTRHLLVLLHHGHGSEAGRAPTAGDGDGYGWMPARAAKNTTTTTTSPSPLSDSPPPLSQISSRNAYLAPPSPIEPVLDPDIFGPRRFLGGFDRGSYYAGLVSGIRILERKSP